MSLDPKDWNKREVWYMKTRTFEVEIHHWKKAPDSNVWNIYAIIGGAHPRYHRKQDSFEELPLHGGVTFVGSAYTDRLGIKIGCDYCHAYDDAFTAASTPEEVPQVFKEASDLFRFLQLEALREMSPVSNEGSL